MWFNSEPSTTEQCKVKYAIYIYSEPFLNERMWLSNVATTIEFFDKRCVMFLQSNLTFRSYFDNFSNAQRWS